MDGFSSDELKRYSRHILLPEVGIEGQQKLKNASVLIVGVGGLGSPLALYLAASGIGRIGIIDFDVVAESNLQRQVLFSHSDLGQKKVNSAREKLQSINPHIGIEIYEESLTSDNAVEIIAKYDIVADGTDNFPTRYLVNDVCMILGKPNVYASIFGFEGQTSVFVKDKGPCYRCLFPSPPNAGSVPSCSEAGVLGVLPGILGTIQATEVIKLILEIGDPLIGRLLTYNALDMSFDEIGVHRNSNCPVCGDNPSTTKPIDYEYFCNPGIKEDNSQVNQKIKEMSPSELKDVMDSGQELLLLDIREKNELNICNLADTVHIPMSEVPVRIHELPEDKNIVVICHLGIRSLNIVNFLSNNGFSRVYNLKGGIDAYAVDCDKNMSRY